MNLYSFLLKKQINPATDDRMTQTFSDWLKISKLNLGAVVQIQGLRFEQPYRCQFGFPPPTVSRVHFYNT